MTGVLAVLAASGGFSLVTYDLDSGSVALPIPTGATAYEIWVIGGGGGGGLGASDTTGGGGAGGGGVYKSGTVLSGEWGANLSRTVGAGGQGEQTVGASNAANGSTSTLTGTLGGVALTLTAGGGTCTQTTTGGTPGGTATGGDTNTAGNIGDNSGSGGVGGLAGINLSGRGRGGNGGAATGSAPAATGVGGRIRVSFT